MLPSVPTYDPWAWLIWGREIAHLDLVTTTGPSWKPLPVLFTIPFSFAGDDGAPLLWIVVARAGGILAYAMAYRLGARLAGPIAGLSRRARCSSPTSSSVTSWRGNSEGFLVALCLWAIERHLDGRRRDAFLLGDRRRAAAPGGVAVHRALRPLSDPLIDRRLEDRRARARQRAWGW